MVTSTICLWVVVLLVTVMGYSAVRHGVPVQFAQLTVGAVAPFVGIGFVAEFVDGALGMGYGIISSVLLVSGGLPPAIASMSVHTVETFTTAASGVSHIRQRNVDWRLFMRLALPGILGGVVGAVAITLVPVDRARPVVLGYLAVIGTLLIFRALTSRLKAERPRLLGLLGFAGGFFDASGGGGWGPIVTGSALLQGIDPRGIVGTINLAEFFVTAVIAISFTIATGIPPISVATLGLLIGGLVAAPIAARMTRKLSPRPLMALIGALLITTALYDLLMRA